MAAKQGKVLREARIRAGLSQAELAEKVGVTQATISNWETIALPAEQRDRLDKILGLDAEASSPAQASPIAAWLNKERVERQLSVPELAAKAGVTPAAIYRIEAGITRNVQAATRAKIEKALGTPLPEGAARELSDDAKITGLGVLEDFDPYADDERPAESGIYVLYDISQRPIYVGEGANVRARIRDHDQKFWFKRPIVESASWIRIKDEKLRVQIERLLIKFLKSHAVINMQNVERR